MSQVKLTLRPPPNVDFVHGYPGIPPGVPDRPQAAVKGAIEVRVGPQGVKAQWVRIELRKVETLPGGGQSNTYYDFVGPSPVNLWQSSDDYAMLQTQDFPFYIRIPESIPPSIALEKNAGIKYELIATVCVKGKKGFLRRRKSTVVSTMAPIIIDKHELHSTWPLYQQPESRHLAQDGVNLTVDRTHTCYGPGDRVSVMATLKSDSLHTVILRGFEFTLKETSVFRAGPNSAKKSAPQVKVTIIGEQKVPVNATLYGGTQHKAELACVIPKDHTTTSLNAARHIDITYVVNVKALMGTGTHLIMDLPVIVSNWPRAVSIEAIRRIGPAPNLSLQASHATSGHLAQADMSNLLSPVSSQNGSITDSYTSPTRMAQPFTPEKSTVQRPVTADARPIRPGTTESRNFRPGTAESRQYNTAPSAQFNGYGAGGAYKADEFGYGRDTSKPVAATVDRPGFGLRPSQSAQAAPPRATARPTDTRRPRSTSNRFTVTNMSDEDGDLSPQGGLSHQRNGSIQRQGSAGVAVTPARTQWPTAEEEKRRLYEQARAKVERVQGSVALTEAPPISQPPAQVDAGTTHQPVATTPPRAATRWPTAEEEKLRLYNQAQAVAQQTQAFGSYSPPPIQANESSDSGGSGPQRSRSTGSQTAGGGGSTGATLYSQALSAMNRSAESNLPSPPKPSPAVAAMPQYPSAEEEKAALKRYHEAKLAVDRTQNSGFPPGDEGSDPIAYDSLYPSNPSGSMPPPFEGSSNPPSALVEKERLRRAYETPDTTSHSDQQALSLPPSYSPTAASGSSGSAPVPEKELLRRALENNDAQPNGAPHPPPRKASLSAASTLANSRPAPRSPPLPPSSGGSRPLTAAEEKAQLQAKYDAEDQNNRSTPLSPPPPPPLMPRPPAEYIQETQAEDARTSMADDPATLGRKDVGLNIRPFTPFSVGFQSVDGNLTKIPGPPPPLPPKFPSSD